MNIEQAILIHVFILLLAACSGEDSSSNPKQGEPARPLSLQTLITDTISQAYSDTGNVYQVSVDPYQTYSIDLYLEVSPATMHGSLYLRVMSLSGQELLTRQTVLPATTGYFEFSTGGQREVLIEVSIQVRTTDFFQYQLAVYPASDNGLLQDADSFEPNNTASTAYYLGLQRTILSALAEGALDHQDIYQVDVLAGETYTLEVSFTIGTSTGADTGLRVAVFDEFGNMLLVESRVEYQQTGYFELTPIQTGKIFSVLYTHPLAQQRYYGYRLVVLPATDNGLVQDNQTLEPNNSLSTAYPINLDNTVSSELMAGTEDHIDVFSVPVQAGNHYSLQLNNVTAIRSGVYNTLYLDVLEVDGTVLFDEQWTYNTESKTFEFIATKNTGARIRLTSHPSRFSDNFQYLLRVEPQVAQ